MIYFLRFTNLKRLTLPNVCDDEILSFIGENCPKLEELDVSGSFGITNQGIRWLTGRERPPVHPISINFGGGKPQGSKLSLQDAIRAKSNPISRIGFQPTPFAAVINPVQEK